MARKCASLALPWLRDDEIFLSVQGVKDIRLTRFVRATVFASWAVLFGGCTPLYGSDLRAAGIDSGQGWYWSKAVSAPEASRIVAEGYPPARDRKSGSKNLDGIRT